MQTRNEKETSLKAFGPYLKHLRLSQEMSLRAVEEATDKEISNAYLSQLETGKVSKPSPNILHALAMVYNHPYDDLMRRAGYIAPAGNRSSEERHGKTATHSIDNLTEEEEQILLEYLNFHRFKNKKK